MNRERLIKLLDQTASRSDEEALSALRKVHEFLARHQTTWEKVIARSRQPAEFQRRREHYDELGLEDVETMLAACLEQVQGSGRPFLESLDRFYRERGYLSAKQVSGLRKFYGRIPAGEGESRAHSRRGTG